VAICDTCGSVVQAPEQFHGRISEKSDVYAVGLILWECWTRKRPWEVADDRDVWGMVFSILSEEKRPEIPDDCPKGLRAILLDCWDNTAKARPTALELKSRLWKLMTHQSRRKPPTAGKGVVEKPAGRIVTPAQPGDPSGSSHCRGASLETVGDSYMDDSVERGASQAATLDWHTPACQPGAGSVQGGAAVPQVDEDSGNMLVPPGSHLFQNMPNGRQGSLRRVDSHPLSFLHDSVSLDVVSADASAAT
jgi:serine/threonine protein kinase